MDGCGWNLRLRRCGSRYRKLFGQLFSQIIRNKYKSDRKNRESYNIGGNNEISNLKLVKKICLIFNNINPSYDHFKLINFVKDRSGHDFRYGINNTKTKKLIGKKFFKNNFDENLLNTINWYLKNKSILIKKPISNKLG